jgi:hypothetical protein
LKKKTEEARDMKRIVFFIAVLIVAAFAAAYAGDVFKEAPAKYRAYNHVKSLVIFDEKHPLFNPFGGIHHVYVNDKGLKMTKSGDGRKFPDGSVLVFVLYEHVQDKGAYAEGARKIEAFMVKDSKKYKDTGGWGFFAYDGKGVSIVKDQKADCFTCHTQVEKKDYVFSEWTK